MSVRRSGYVFAALGTTVFSFTLPMVKIALKSFDPWAITFMRMAIAGATAAIVFALKRVPLPPRELWRTIVLTGAGISIGFPVLSTLAMQRTTSAHGAVIIASLPLVTALFAVVSHGERVPWTFWAGAITGALALSTYAWRHGGSADADAFADLLLIGAVLSSAFGYSEGARLSKHMPGWQVVSWCVVFWLPVSAVAAVLTQIHIHTDRHVTSPSLLALLFISFGSMYLGFFAWYRGLADLGVARGSQVQMMQPLLTLLWSALIIGEVVPPEAVGTAIVVLACVAVTQRARRSPRVAPPSGVAVK